MLLLIRRTERPPCFDHIPGPAIIWIVRSNLVRELRFYLARLKIVPPYNHPNCALRDAKFDLERDEVVRRPRVIRPCGVVNRLLESE